MKRRFTLMKGLVEEALKNVSQRLLMMVSVMKAQGKNVLTGVLLSHVFFVASYSQERNVLLSQYDSCHRHAPEQRIAPFAIQAVGSPLVRLAYVIPSNRKPQANGVVNLQNAIKKGQQWYREQMEQNGFGPKTFAVETEADGVTPLVHVVNVTETDEYLRGDIWGRSLQAAINAGLSIWGTGEVWVVIPEAHLMLSDGTVTGGIAGGAGSGNGNSSGVAMISSNALPLYDPAMIADDTPYDGEVLPALGPFPMKQDVTFAWFEGRTFSSIASSWQGALVHEMGHAFGLAHDFRNDNNFHGNLMGNGLRGIRGNLFPERYPQDYTRLEFAAASILNLNHYFNRDKRSTSPPFVTFNNPGSVIPQQGLVNIIFQASDNDLLAFAHLRYDGNTVSEIPLQGSSATGTFAVPYYAKGATNSYIIAVHDVEGNITYHNIQVSVQGGHNQAPVPFMQINPPAPGENQSIELNASGSSDVDNALTSVVASWDVNNDGQFDTQPSTNKVVQHQYEYGGNYLIRLKLTDPEGGETISTPVSIKITGEPPPPGNNGTGLKGEYFNNINLTGIPMVNRVDPRVDFVWNMASPATGISQDNFSVRWTGQVEAPTTGNFVFSTVSDDGVRLWVNNLQVINNWTDHGPTTNNSAAIPLVAGTKYDIRMEFYEHTAGAVARLLWAYPGQAQQAIPQSRLYPGDAGTSDTEAPSVPSNLGLAFRPTESSFSLVWQSSTDNVGVTGYEVFRDGISIGTTSQIFFDVTGLLPGTTYLMTVRARDAEGNWSAQSAPSVVTTAGVPGTNGTGLQAEYFNNTNLTGAPVVSRVDARVDFIWNLASPAPGIYPDNFSVRWTGQVFAPVPGNYVFSTVSDDGIRLWINGTQVINNWTDHGPTTNNSAPIPLLANTKYEIRMEFYERTAGAVARLLWSYPGQPQQPIPQSRLFSSGGTTDVIAPTVPSGLASSNITQSSFTLSWTASTDNVGVTAYEVFRNGISIGTTSTTSLSITGLLSATKYAVTVRARDAIGNYSGQSSALDVTTAGTPTSGNGTGLRGEYFNNVNLTGTSVVNRVDPQVDFNWNLAAPAMGINPDNFSIRWSGQVEAPATANFVFSTVSDDGIRLWINGIQVINNWTDHGPTTNNSTPIPLVSGTKYDIRMEFYERTYGAVARLLWAYPGQAQQAIPQSRLYPSSGGSTSTGLSAAYFNNVNLTGTPVVNRVDSQVDFVWNLVSPATGINADNFSVRWTGQVEAVVSGNYVFSTVSDDGVRLFINGTQVINNWTDHGPTTNNSAAIPLTAGTRYDIRMEFYDHTYGAVAKLLWTYPGQAQQPIPQSRLYPAASISTTGIAAASLDQNGEQLSTEGDLTLISVYPNPASGGLINIKHEGKIEQAYVILMDDNGNVLLQRPLSEQPVEQLDISAVREGIHYLRVVSPEGEQIIRLVVE